MHCDYFRISQTRGGANLQVGEATYYLANFSPKTAWKWKNLDPEGSVHFGHFAQFYK